MSSYGPLKEVWIDNAAGPFLDRGAIDPLLPVEERHPLAAVDESVAKGADERQVVPIARSEGIEGEEAPNTHVLVSLGHSGDCGRLRRERQRRLTTPMHTGHVMRALVLTAPGRPLEERDLPVPDPAPGEVLVRVTACGVCRTDLHVADGELPDPKVPLVLGHQIVGRVEGSGERVGIPWLGWACGECRYCRSGRENLCDLARFTGYQRDGGYAEYAVADERFCLALPESYGDIEAAPLLCAGLIGYRALRQAGEGERLGLYGFGASAHIVAQVARHQGQRIFAFTRPGDLAGQEHARSLGAEWAGGSDSAPPEELDAAIIFAPLGPLIPAALRAVAKGGAVVCAGIHMSDIPAFPYELLWGERSVRSVANLTRKDGEEFLALAPQIPVRTDVEIFPLEQANEALERLRSGRLHGAAVLRVSAD
jgi:alcohol dehydrogenase, propanol-preferring